MREVNKQWTAKSIQISDDKNIVGFSCAYSSFSQSVPFHCTGVGTSFFKGWKVVNAYFGSSEGYYEHPEMPGNYAIFSCPMDFQSPRLKESTLHYIGTSSNLKRRLRSHPIKSIISNKSCNYIYIKCKVITDKNKRLHQEYLLINKLRPEYNNEPKKRRFTSNAFLCR